jgi:hypothetical protein
MPLETAVDVVRLSDVDDLAERQQHIHTTASWPLGDLRLGERGGKDIER